MNWLNGQGWSTQFRDDPLVYIDSICTRINERHHGNRVAAQRISDLHFNAWSRVRQVVRERSRPRDVGTRGLNAQTAVDLANQRGVTLDRASVSSLLSRLKKDDVVVFDNEVYRLKEFAPRPAQVHEFPKANAFK